MAVVALSVRSRQGEAAAPPAPSEVLRIFGTPSQVAAVLAGLINDGWVFDALPVTRGRGLWLVSARRPAQHRQEQLHA